MKALTRKQREALWAIYKRDNPSATMPMYRRGYMRFRRKARLDHFLGCVMVPWAGMWLGIEPDGYTHS